MLAGWLRVDLVQFLVYSGAVKRVNMHDAKPHLPRYVAELEPGEGLVLCSRHEPVAELRAISKPSTQKPRLGVAKGMFTIPDSFFDPLPDDILKGFYGE